jgi:hypothetical protein
MLLSHGRGHFASAVARLKIDCESLAGYCVFNKIDCQENKPCES